MKQFLNTSSNKSKYQKNYIPNTELEKTLVRFVSAKRKYF